MRSMILASAIASIVFAKADAAGSGKSANSAPPPPPDDAAALNTPVGSATPGSNTGTPAADGLPAGVTTDGGSRPRNVAAIRADLPPPAPKRSGPRLGQSLYDFDKLEIGQSFGLLDKSKTAKKFASTITSTNHRYDAPVKNADGSTVLEDGAEIKDANGVVTGRAPGKPKMQATRRFVCADVDPATDPDGATVRVWRVALPTA